MTRPGEARLIVRLALIGSAVFAALALDSGSAYSQGYPFSQRVSVVQNVAHTTISLEYGRPVARGRALFGSLVPWDSVWHPGADSASRISFSRDVVIEGKQVPRGDYSLWLIPRKDELWTLILNRESRIFHRPYPGAASDELRIDVAPEIASHMESMAIFFPMVLRDDAVLAIHWGTTILPVRLKAPYRPPVTSDPSP